MNRKTLILLGCVLSLVLFSCSCTLNPAQVVSEIATIIGGLIPIIAAAGSVLLPGEAAAINAGVAIVTAGLKALENLVSGYHASPSDAALAKVTAAFADVQANLTELEAAARVQDPATQRKLLAIVSAATQSLAALESSMAATHPAAVAAAQATSS
jgi:hypothetical protein